MLAAGVEVLREKSYADLTVRVVAARAKVAPATAYTYHQIADRLGYVVGLLLGPPGDDAGRNAARDGDTSDRETATGQAELIPPGDR